MKKFFSRPQVLAVIATLLIAALLALWLATGRLSWDRSALTQTHPEADSQPEELFIEPELIDLGETETPMLDEPAPSEIGEPVKTETEEVKKPVEPVESERKVGPAKPRLNTQTRESRVKEPKPKADNRERKEASSRMAGKFSGKNGAADGKFNSSDGAGGTGVGVAGNARGRTFLGCPKPVVELTHKTVVTVDITVNEEGAVTAASARGSASATIRRKCEQSAWKARWSKKKGAGDTRGTITFTITPR